MKKRVGDTLIEVTLAIGIFSMVAIAVVAVMNGGTTGSQAALESTLAREEIDTQAETLRFIQSAFVADKDSGIDDNVYNGLWGEISDLAIDLDSEEQKRLFDSIINNTTSCENVYGTDFFKNHAFFIDPNDMNIITDKISMANNRLIPATTYPRLLSDNPSGQPQTLLEDGDVSSGSDLKAEGIYILAVKDDKTTTITDADNQSTKEKSAFYDFYVRSCWYGAGEDTPSTISTIVRLYNPSATVVASEATGEWVSFNVRDDVDMDEEAKKPIFVPTQGANELPTASRCGFDFLGWSKDENSISGKTTYKAPDQLQFNNSITLYPIWKHDFTYKTTGGYFTTDGITTQEIKISHYKDDIYQIADKTPEWLGHKFLGWCTTEVDLNDNASTCRSKGGSFYQSGDEYTIETTSCTEGDAKTTFFAMWEMHPDTVFLLDSTGSMSSMISSSKAGITTLADRTLELGGKVSLYDYRDLAESDYYPEDCRKGVNRAWVKDGCVAAKMRCGFSTCNRSNIASQVSNISVNGGGDGPESLLGALYYIMTTSAWSEGFTKSIIVVTDANYLEPERNGVTYQDVINKARELAPLNIYIVTNTSYQNYYSKIAGDTNGKVVLINNMVDGLEDIIK